MVSVPASQQCFVQRNVEPAFALPHRQQAPCERGEVDVFEDARSELESDPADSDVETDSEAENKAPSRAVSYIASPSLWQRLYAQLSGRAFSAAPPVGGANRPLSLLRTYYQQGLDGVVDRLWRGARDEQDFCYGWVAGQLVVVLRSPQVLHAAFSDHSASTSRLFPNYEAPFGGLYRIFGNNVFTKHGADLRQARQVVLHRFFIRRNVNNHFATILQTADKHIDDLLNSVGRVTDDVGKCMVAYTMDTWSRAQLGMPGLSVAGAMRLSDAISRGEALATSAKHLIWRGIIQRLHVRDLATPDKAEKALRHTLFSAMREELIDPYRAKLQTSDNLLRALADSEAAAGRDGSMQADAVMSELAILLLTGHETAASLLTWTLCELARNPGALARLKSQIAGHFGDQPPHPGNIDRLPYLDQVLNEALRLHPPAPYLGRNVTRAFTIPTRQGPVTFPENTVLATSLISQHRIKRVWGEDAEIFRPERFADKTREELNLNFIPFSVGDRRCAGYPFALLEAKIFLVRLLQRTNFTLPDAPGIKPVYVGVLKTAKPLRMQVEPKAKPTL